MLELVLSLIMASLTLVCLYNCRGENGGKGMLYRDLGIVIDATNPVQMFLIWVLVFSAAGSVVYTMFLLYLVVVVWVDDDKYRLPNIIQRIRDAWVNK